MERVLIVLASLFGFFGVLLAAMAGHMKDVAQLRTASNILLFHAPALLGIAALNVSLLNRRIARVAACVMAFGVAAFCTDLAFRAYQGQGLVPMLAPIGGFAMMMGWLLTLFFVFGTRRD